MDGLPHSALEVLCDVRAKDEDLRAMQAALDVAGARIRNDHRGVGCVPRDGPGITQTLRPPRQRGAASYPARFLILCPAFGIL
jgi:hypothetical protein